MLLPAILLAGLVLATPALSFEPVAVLEGRGHAADGDGIRFGEVEVRLQGVAAPEDNGAAREPGGPAATAALAALVDGRVIRCELDGTTVHRRPVGICYAGGRDLGEVLVAIGHARDCPRFSGGRYRGAERQARAAGRDLSASYALPGYCR